jgi:hypothetical protein
MSASFYDNRQQQRRQFGPFVFSELKDFFIVIDGMRFFSFPKFPDGTRAHPASYLWILGLLPYRNATGA